MIVLESGGPSLESCTQALNEVEIVGLDHSGSMEGRGRAIQGTSKLWAGQCLPFDPVDFQERPWVPHSGWPFDADHLAPYYRRAEAFFKVDGHVYDERNYGHFGLTAPRWSAGALRTHFTVYTPQIDTGHHHLRVLRHASSLRVVSNATVVGIDLDSGGGSAAAVRARSLCGRECKVNARAFVLCAGGLENARILLNSDHQRRGGLGNGDDLIGRFFQEHPNGIVASLTGDELRRLQDRFRLLYRGPFRFFPKFALREEQQRQARVLNANAHLVFEYGNQPGIGVMRELLHAARSRRMPARPLSQMGKAVRNIGSLGTCRPPALHARSVSGRTTYGSAAAMLP